MGLQTDSQRSTAAAASPGTLASQRRASSSSRRAGKASTVPVKQPQLQQHQHHSFLKDPREREVEEKELQESDSSTEQGYASEQSSEAERQESKAGGAAGSRSLKRRHSLQKAPVAERSAVETSGVPSISSGVGTVGSSPARPSGVEAHLQREASSAVQYPANLTVKDFLLYTFAPVLVYSPNYPRTSRIRWAYLMESE